MASFAGGLLLCGVVGGGIVAQNILPNGSFEAGGQSWTVADGKGAVVDGEAWHGQRSYRLECAGKALTLWSDVVAVAGGTDLTVSAYVRTAGAAKARLALWAVKDETVGSGRELELVAVLPKDQPAWARFRSIVRVPKEALGVRVQVLCTQGRLDLDAVQLERGRFATPHRSSKPLAGLVNRLPNPAMEPGQGGWLVWSRKRGGTYGWLAAGQGRNRTGGLYLHADADEPAHGFSLPIPCTPGETLTLSVWAKGKGATALAPSYLDGRGARLDERDRSIRRLESSVADYRRSSLTFVVPPKAHFVKAELLCRGGEAWWDDCQLESGAAMTDNAAGPTDRQVADPTAALAYTQDVIREARVRDVLAQTRRLLAYRDAEVRVNDRLAAVRERVATLTKDLGASFVVPAFRDRDRAAWQRLCDETERDLAALWREVARSDAGLFDPWQPAALAADIDRTRLAREFLLIPAFLGELGHWDTLRPFGFRAVSCWANAWLDRQGKLVPAPVLRTIQQCADQGYRCSLMIDGAIAAAEQLEPTLGKAIYLQAADGNWARSGSSHHSVNIWHPEVRRVAAAYLQELAALAAASPDVLAFELSNEPSLALARHAQGYQYEALGSGGYNPEAKVAFRRWLQTKYPNTQALNASWRANYRSFDAVEPPSVLEAPIPSDNATPLPLGPTVDFQRFRAESHARWFLECTTAMRRGGLRQPIVSQISCGFLYRPDAAIDLWNLARDAGFDYLGTHDWPADLPAVESLYVASMNAGRALPQWEDELPWSHWSPKAMSEPEVRATLERNVWRQVAWGKRALVLFTVDSEWNHDNRDNWNNALLNVEADLEIPRYSVGLLPTLERKVHRIKDQIFDATVVFGRVAVLRPTAATVASAPRHACLREARAVTAALLRRHVLPRLVAEEQAEDLAGYEVIFVPWGVCLTSQAQQALLARISAGATVIASGPPGVFDASGGVESALLEPVFGKVKWRYADGRWSTDAASDAQAPLQGLPAPSVARRHGKGWLLIALQPFGERTDKVVEAAVEQFGLADLRCKDQGVELVPLQATDGRRLLFVVNLDVRRPRQIGLAVRGRLAEVVELSHDAQPQVPVDFVEGWSRIRLDLEAGGGVVLAAR